MVKDRKSWFFYGYIIVVAAFFIQLLLWGTNNTFGVFFEPMLAEFGWTRAITAGAMSFGNFLFGFFCIASARLCDRFGPRIVIGACGFILGLGYLLMSQIGALWQLYLFRGVVIAAGMSAYIAVLSIVTRWFVRRRGVMTGVVFSGLGLGNMVFPPLASWLISIYDWRTSYAIIGIVTLVLSVAAAQFLRRDPAQMELLPYGEHELKPESSVSEVRWFSLQEAIHTRQFWLICGMYFAFLFCLLAIMVHIVIHAIGLGISAANAANILAIIGVFSIVGINIMGVAGDRFSNKLAFVMSFILMAIAFLWLPLAVETWMFYLFAVIFGFAYGGMQVLFSPIIAELFGLNSHGIILAAAAFAGTIGASIAPVFAGYIFDISGSYQWAFLVCTVLSVTGVILTVLLKPIGGKGGENDQKRGT